jgi:hypothetical protein
LYTAVTTTVPTISSQFAMGRYTCSWNLLLVCTVLMCGKYDMRITCVSSWKLLVIMACDATMAASTAMTIAK